ncbi:Fatty acid oxidation complex subunit alpha [bioreactor metagenome]|jgi:3-hydroxyacyl-CoA dehydrogenase|uniref:Fatty acid oxidation complex subunit alpha n=1 Tax=bioreactor metagenome TaxID=1076179 RepID=A0A644TY16_9ZZZZ|nr:3-hydroxyacyl-CoA dehydrogenase NAD-binding domain-containing protein [Lentimicrobium sp.]MEA5111744.1 3-hydroxyacyl-CoA dehydrogenase family protein [Lentimicrobium sp.]
MEYTERLSNITVLGAAGKMGSGILLLSALEVADEMLKPGNRGKHFVVNAVDVTSSALPGLMKYIRAQVLKAAEKKTVQLRKIYAGRKELIENSEIIEAYIDDVMSIIRPGTRIEAAYDSTLIFEAVSENPGLKTRLFRQINENNPNQPWFFTNTSSVPIGSLNKEAELGGRILGFHFYNPPAVQKLVELITIGSNSSEMKQFALQLAKNMRKVVVPSNDIAGFIGNGHFMRDALYGIEQATALAKEMPLHEAIYAINRVSQDFLMRPMGIFQLIDYVGVDVVRFIMNVMNPYMREENLHSPLLDRLFGLSAKGGQYADGSQKDGFLKYDKGRPVAVFSPDKGDYIPVSGFDSKVDAMLGALPGSALTWKNLVKAPDKEAIAARAFADYKTMGTIGASMALQYARKSREIGMKLVSNGVAATAGDVNTVLLTGFFHAYGPINDFVV